MIRAEPVAVPAARAPRARTTLARVPLPLSGPGRADDRAVALRRDLDEIAAMGGSVDEADLLLRGWSLPEIIEHLPAARRIGRDPVDLQ